MSKIENALKAANETRALRIGSGILNQVPEMFTEQFPGKTAVIIADNNTYRVAGAAVYESLKTQEINQAEPFIFNDPELHAEYSYIDQLTAFLKTNEAIPVAVGSGTINDLVKLASHLTGRRYICVATAASMDGYTAFGASITADGAKQTFNCPAPQACLADIDIISEAPSEMTASGYADLFAKITAGADWILSDRLNVEPIDKQAWSIVQDGLHDSLSDPQGVKSGNQEAISNLTEGLMLGGFAMQWHKTSRPASGAEHQFSHLWNMEHHLNNGEHVSHGFQVSIGTLSILAFYEKILETPIEKLDVKACCNAWPTPEESDKQALKIFEGTDFPEIGLQETRAKYISREALADQLNLLVQKWPEIKTDLKKQLVPYAEAKKRLKLVGAPTEPEEIGISRARLRETFIRAQYLRRRFTVLDLAVRTNLFEKWLDGLFGKGGIWKI
ncbi:MAG: 3-dehydroquinate synthase [Bacteroidetes bacterium GWF2_42_66]|nr:MAG: 3-dehydroquinate synthase [Bacteroidetes bacterium GWA2_42_15]OFX97335.1 MAG: 3-dehydroquinate synthase [Bacteroidetes bacterium GWE2_42_39]OFY39972.1 MAG: 3-dehydroquinate synthase [Bacteroidetes bacterium GWF2_42_66]HAZ03507.1 3-dehydroquinate synthase [Marinilabiliales bacterium]HBL78164.1 3-dehydroquinate synthase [Prolixibacteraceae bacterium]